MALITLRLAGKQPRKQMKQSIHKLYERNLPADIYTEKIRSRWRSFILPLLAATIALLPLKLHSAIGQTPAELTAEWGRPDTIDRVGNSRRWNNIEVIFDHNDAAILESLSRVLDRADGRARAKAFAMSQFSRYSANAALGQDPVKTYGAGSRFRFGSRTVRVGESAGAMISYDGKIMVLTDLLKGLLIACTPEGYERFMELTTNRSAARQRYANAEKKRINGQTIIDYKPGFAPPQNAANDDAKRTRREGMTLGSRVGSLAGGLTGGKKAPLIGAIAGEIAGGLWANHVNARKAFYRAEEDRVQAAIAQTDKNLEAAQAELKKLASKNDALERHLRELRASQQGSAQKLTAHTKQVASVDAQIEKVNESIAQLQDQQRLLRAAEFGHEEGARELAALRKKRESLRVELERYDAELVRSYRLRIQAEGGA